MSSNRMTALVVCMALAFGAFAQAADTPAKPADKAAADKAAVDKAVADKAAADKAVADKAVADKAVADEATADKTAADKAVADKAAADKAAVDKAAADEAVADKAAAVKGPTTQPATAPAVAKGPTTQPASAPSMAKGPTTRPATTTTTAKAERTVMFQYKDTPYTEIVRSFADFVGKPIMGDLNIEGTLTFYDSQPYTYEDALDTLNILLEMQGYALKIEGRFIRLYQVAELTGTSTILKGLDEGEGLRGSEVVTVVLPVKYIDAGEAAKAVVRMVSSFGAISPLGKGKGIVITDRLANIQRIRGFIDMLDTKSMVERQTISVQLEHASVRAVAETIDKLFGRASVPSRSVYSRDSGRYIRVSDQGKDVVTTVYDERTKLLFMIGTSDRLDMAKELVEKLDVPETGEGDLRIYQFEHAKVDEVSKIITAALPQKQIGYDSRYRRPIMGTTAKLIPDRATNRLIWSAPADEIKDIEELLIKLDLKPTDLGGAKVIPLKVADATQLAAVVAQAVTRTDSRGTRRAVVAVSADKRTNSLILAGESADMRTAELLIKELDKKQPDDGREIHVIYIKNGNVTSLAASLVRMFSEQSTSPGSSRWGRPSTTSSSRIRVEAEPATNSLLISCMPADWEIVQDILKKLDASIDKAETMAPTTRILPLKHAKATELAETLRQILGGGGGRTSSFRSSSSSGYSRYRSSSYTPTPTPSKTPVVITASEPTNSLVVSASAEDHEKIAALVKQMDVVPTAKVDPVKIITIKSANASKLAETLRAMLPPAGRDGATTVFVQADETSNSVLIRAPEGERAMLEKMIASLDKPELESARVTSLVQLVNASAAEVAAALNTLYQSSATSSRSYGSSSSRSYGGSSSRRSTSSASDDRVIITPAPGDKAIIVDAPRRMIEDIERLAKSLDTEDALGRFEIRTYKLIDTTSAADVARSLANVFAKSVRRSSDYGRSSSTARTNEPRFEADPTSNVLIVSATKVQFVEIEKLIDKLQEILVVLVETKTFKLEFAKADELVTVLETMLGQDTVSRYMRSRSGSPASQKVPVRVGVMTSANSIIVQGPPEKVAMAKDLIDKFDTKDSGVQTDMKIVKLDKADATTLAAAISKWISSAGGGGGSSRRSPWAGAGGTSAGVTVTPETNTNSLLVHGPTKDVPAVVERIKELDKDADDTGTVIRIFPLEKSDATQLASSLGTLFQDIIRQETRGRTGATAPPFSISANERTNSLVVSTTPAHFAIVESLIKTLDSTDPKPGPEVQYVYLDNVDATEVAMQLASMFPPTAGVEQPVIEADFYTNAITIIGSKTQLEKIQGIIKQLDIPDNSIHVRVIVLTQARAENMAQALQRVYSNMGRGKILISDDVPAKPTGDGAKIINPAVAPKAAGADKAGADEGKAVGADKAGADEGKAIGANKTGADKDKATGQEPKGAVTIVVDKEANALIIAGTRNELADIEDLIDQFTISDMEAGAELRSYPIEEADPASVARTLSDLFNPKRTTQTTVTTTDERGRRSTQRVPPPPPVLSAVPDPRTKTLFVRAKPLDFEMIEPMIKQLDQQSTYKSGIRIFQLKNADPTEVAENIRELFALGRSSASSSRSRTTPTRSRTGRDGRSAWSSPTDQRAEAVRQMIEFQLADGATNKVDASQAISVTPNKGSNSVVVVAPPDSMKLIENVIKELDQNDLSVAASVQMYPLKHAEVAPTVTALQALFIPRTGGTTRGGGSGRAAAPPVVIVGDEGSGRVIVSAQPDKHELISKAITQLDEAQGKENPTVKVYRIQHVDATTVSTALNNSLGTSSTAARGGTGGGRGGTSPRGGASSLRINADSGSNSLVVRASAEDHAEIARLLLELDVPTTVTTPVRVIPLNHADAANVAAILTRVMASSATPGSSRRGGSISGRRTIKSSVIIEADADSRMLMVRADDETFEKVRALAQQMDVPPLGAVARTILPLKFAQAAPIAAALTQTFAPARGQRISPDELVTIVAEPVSNMLIVMANPDNLKRVEAMLTRLDAEGANGNRREILLLKHARAADLVTALERVAVGMSSGGRGRGVGAAGVTITADPASNALIMSGPSGDLDTVMKMAMQLDIASVDKAPGVYIIKLESGDAVAMANMITGLYRDIVMAARLTNRSVEPIAVTADERANALVLAGSKTAYEQVSVWVAQIEKMKPAPGQMRLIKLDYADPDEVQRAIDQMFGINTTAIRSTSGNSGSSSFIGGRGGNTGRPTGGNMRRPTGGSTGRPTGGSMRRPTGGSTGRPTGGSMRRPTGGSTGRPTGGTRRPTGGTRRPTGGSTGRPTGGTSRRSPRGPGGTSGATSGQIQTTALPSQRAILVDASDADYEAILALVKMLDQAADKAKPVVQVFKLKHASNQRVGEALGQVFRSTRDETIIIRAIEQSNTLLVSATKERMEDVAHLIEQLDEKTDDKDVEIKIFPVANVQPTKILAVLQRMLDQIAKTRPGEEIIAEADERTKSIIVTANPAVFDQIDKVIKTLDKPAAFKDTEVMVVQLKRADAEVLAGVLTDMLRPSETATVTPEARALQEQVRLLRIRGGADGAKLPELDLTKPIKIIADPGRPQGSNALIITSTPDNLKAMRAIVELMDTMPLTEDVDVRLVHLENADAASVMDILIDIFNKGQELAGQQGSSTEGKAEPTTASGKALVNPLAVSADERTNTLVVAGQTETLVLAELIIQDLDRQKGKIITAVKLFRLKHADVTRLVPVLTAVFAESTTAEPGAEGLQTHVTRLKTILEKKGGTESKIAKVRAALTIQADETTNIIVVAAREDVMPLIADVIETMDVPGAGSLNTVRLYAMQHADVTAIETIITALHTGPNANLMRDEDKPTVGVDARTNSLVISASDKTFIMLDALLKQLDRKTPIELRDIRMLTLKNADAATLAGTLGTMMEARVQRLASLGVGDAEALAVIVVADVRSNSLIVGGSPEGFGVVKELAEKLDGANPALGGQIQLLPLKHANAGTLAASLTSLFDTRYAAAPAAEVQRQKPIILPDLRVNALLVAANEDDTKVLKGLLPKMDVKLTDPAVKIVVIPMKHNDSGVVGPAISQIFEARLEAMTAAGTNIVAQDRVNVVTDVLSNVLIISASKENLALIDDLLAKVDIEPPTETGIVRMYMLKNSDAQRISTMLQSLVSQGLYKPGLATSSGTSAALAAREKVSITVDIRTNVLIISASKENFAVIEEIIKTIDKSSDFGGLADVRMFILKRADAMRMAPTLQELFDAKLAAEKAAGGAVSALSISVIPDARTNTLLVTGSREGFVTIEAIIKQLDAEDVTVASDFKVFQLKLATASALQPTLEELLSQRVTRDPDKDPISVIADSRLNAIIIGASAEDMKLAESLISQLDKASKDSESSLHVFPLKKADAEQVATTLENLYESEGATAVSVSFDERINAILVQAGAADAERIGELVAKLDQEKVSNVTEIRVFPLKNADATELAEILNETLNTKPDSLTDASPNRQTLLQFVTQAPDGKKLIANALQEGMLITPNPRANSLVISAPLTIMPLLKSLITAMDSTNPRKAEIKIIRLKNADALRMSEVLQQIFSLERTGSESGSSTRAVNYRLIKKSASADKGADKTKAPPAGAAKDDAKDATKGATKGAPGDAGAANGATAGDQDVSATVGADEHSALNITVDARTNSLLVGGTTQYVTLCVQVIEELDILPAQEREVRVYHPRNASPEDIETALTSFLDQEAQTVSSTMGTDRTGSPDRLLEREVSVVAEATSGTLLLSASPRYFDTLMKMVEELDKAPPQVLIQVMLAEVMLDDTMTTGIDWMFRDSYGGTTVTGGSGLGVGTSIGVGGGLSLSVSGSDLSYFLQALQNQGRLEVLSRPQILASNNQVADINVGERVPLITSSRITDAGDTINTIQYEPLGIKLEVTPRISPDGFVRMEISPEISALSSSSVDISTGVTANIITNRSANTTATVRDGHTIVIGGLITTRDDNREKKVPVLGDLPLLGALFRTSTVVKQRTELLIILTPHILANEADTDKETDLQLKRLKLLRQTDKSAAAKTKRASSYIINDLLPIAERRDKGTVLQPITVTIPGMSDPKATTKPATKDKAPATTKPSK